MTGEEATALGYRRISNTYRIVARIDRADWLEHMATTLRRAPADFYVRGRPTLTEVDGGWCDHYRRCLSKDRVVLTPEEFRKVPGSGHDPVGYVEAPGAPVSPRYVVRIRATPGRGDPVVSWLTRTARASSGYAAAARFDSEAEAWDFIRACGEDGRDEAGPWCDVVPDTREEAARQMDEALLHRLDNPWLYRDLA